MMSTDLEGKSPSGMDIESKSGLPVELDEAIVGSLAKETVVVAPRRSRDAWMSLASACLSYSCAIGYVLSIGVYIAYYKATLLPNYTLSTLAWIGTIGTFQQLFWGAPFGKLCDMGHYRKLLLVATCLYTLCLFSIASATKYWQLILAQGIGLGLCQGLVFVPNTVLVAAHFPDAASLYIGVALASGGGIGGIVIPIMLNNLMQKIGFPWAIRTCGFLYLALLILANLLARPAAPHPRPLGAKRISKKAAFMAMLRDTNYMIMLICGCILFFASFTGYSYLQVFGATSTNAGPTLSFYLLPLASVGGTLSLIPNALAQRYGVYNAFAPTVFVVAVVYFVWPACTSIAGVVSFALVFGCFCNAMTTMFAPSIAAISKDPSDFGFKSGLAWTIASFFCLIGSPVAGAVVGVNSWWRGGVLNGALLLVAVALLLWVRRTLAKEQNTWRV